MKSLTLSFGFGSTGIAGRLAVTLATWLVVLTSVASAAATPNLFEFKGFALGREVTVRIQAADEASAQTAIGPTLAAIRQVEVELDSDGFGWVARLNAAAGLGSEPIEPDAEALLRKALGFCHWTEGAFGPLGGPLHKLWGLSSSLVGPVVSPMANQAARGLPTPSQLAEALASGSCGSLALAPGEPVAALASGSRLDLRPLAAGYALDQGHKVLVELGHKNFYLQLGRTYKASGPGPQGRGWRVDVDSLGGQYGAGPLLLQDQALHVIVLAEDQFRVGGEVISPYLNQRTGQPTGKGIVAVLAVSQQAVDAQGLAQVMVILGNRQGQLRLGGLSPPPSIRWLLGSGSASPIVADHRWHLVKRP